MYFDFEDYHPDIEPVGHAISWRDEIFLSIAFHIALVALLIFAPRWLPARRIPTQSPFQLSANDRSTFVFVRPKFDLEALKAPQRGGCGEAPRQRDAAVGHWLRCQEGARCREAVVCKESGGIEWRFGRKRGI